MSPSTADLSITADERYLQSLIYGLIISTGILSMILYTRVCIIKVFGLDDIAVCIALVITQAFNGLGVAIVYYGEGKHFSKVSPEDRAMWLKIAPLLLSTLLTLEKAVLRGDVHLPLRLLVRQTQLVVIPSTDLRQTATYDLSITNPTCYSQFKLFQITLYQAVLIFVCDVIILIAPLVVLCGLQLPTRKVIALMLIFGSGLYTPRYKKALEILILTSGIIACISPVVRFSTLDYLRYGTADLTYDSASSLYWMAIEFNLGLVAGSLSSLKPLPIFRRFGSTINSGDKASTGAKSHELFNMESSEPAIPKKRKISMGMGTTILQDTVNESQENIIHATNGDYGQRRAEC
ncbi:uncharacterized protein N7487_009465 [Penicillium crustosum]|uniref:uncharacterized protein n=1 Tax=Penicillium crustosum TaxID=36656 RepID=UPI0023A28028|nr:uncharacterized protein N7487_009465 [Penicillium crustosum]KAJ5395162.1 hypothetical protein N7487_009465 [Penicillium crustosum]